VLCSVKFPDDVRGSRDTSTERQSEGRISAWKGLRPAQGRAARRSELIRTAAHSAVASRLLALVPSPARQTSQRVAGPAPRPQVSMHSQRGRVSMPARSKANPESWTCGKCDAEDRPPTDRRPPSTYPVPVVTCSTTSQESSERSDLPTAGPPCSQKVWLVACASHQDDQIPLFGQSGRSRRGVLIARRSKPTVAEPVPS